MIEPRIRDRKLTKKEAAQLQQLFEEAYPIFQKHHGMIQTAFAGFIVAWSISFEPIHVREKLIDAHIKHIRTLLKGFTKHELL